MTENIQTYLYLSKKKSFEGVVNNVVPETLHESSIILHACLHPFASLRHCSLKYVQSMVSEVDSFSKHRATAEITRVMEQQQHVYHITAWQLCTSKLSY